MPFAKRHWLNSLSLKVLLAYVAGVALSVVLIVLATIMILSLYGDVLSGQAVAERTADLARMLRFDRQGMPIGFDESGDDTWQQQSLKTELAYRVLDAQGVVVLSSPTEDSIWPSIAAPQGALPPRFEFEHRGVAMLGATETVLHNGVAWHLQFAASARFLHLIYRDFALPFTGAGIVLFSLLLLFAFGICAYFTLRYTLGSLRAVSEAAAAITPQSLHSRLHTTGVPSELIPLVESFNRALERLEKGYRSQQDFLATAAHELKTPLALIRGQIELGVSEDNRSILLQDISHMGRQVQQLLHLAEASEPQNYQFGTVDVEELIQEVVHYLDRLALQHGVTIESQVDPDFILTRADHGALFTLLKNLLENAIQHSPRGAIVDLQARPEGISVRDHGQGVPLEDMPKLFTRFWRSAERRDLGAGLGLSICQEIASVHGWSLETRDAEPGLLFHLNTCGHQHQGPGAAELER